MPIGQQHSRCNLCQKDCDTLGDHSLTCLNGGHRTGAHGAILDLLMSFAAASAAQPQREPHAIPGAPNLRLDLAFSFPRDGSTYLVDVAFTHPLATSNIQHAGPARAATAYEKIKFDKYGEAIKRGRPDAKFVPVIVDTFGGTGASCQPMLKAFCKLRAEHTDTHESTATRILFHRLVFTAVTQAARIASMNAVWFSHIDG